MLSLVFQYPVFIFSVINISGKIDKNSEYIIYNHMSHEVKAIGNTRKDCERHILLQRSAFHLQNNFLTYAASSIVLFQYKFIVAVVINKEMFKP